MSTAPATLAECGADFLDWLETREEEPVAPPPQERLIPPPVESMEYEVEVLEGNGTRILFIDFEPTQMKELWLGTRRYRYGDFRVMFADIRDSQLWRLVEFEPFIVVICNDHTEADEALPPFLRNNPALHIVVVPYHDHYPNDPMVCEEFDLCARTSQGLEDAISDIIPF